MSCSAGCSVLQRSQWNSYGSIRQPAGWNDDDAGSRSEPLSTIQKATGMYRPGDTISLLAEKSIYRQ